ncbi:MAG TPA: hypothetical protein VLZ05_11235 [Mycobacterium sp.]|nr:hypothetical protein [Mycobacterium sp.]HUH69396.1 hypothetical protein [Mycobacterium sp.]
MASSSPGDSAIARAELLGHCLPGRDYMVCDREGQVVATGAVGKLCIRGPLTMSGCLRPDSTLDPAVDEAG